MLRAGDDRDTSSRDSRYGFGKLFGKAWSSIIRHVLWLDRHRRWRRVFPFDCRNARNVVREQWIIAQVGAKAREVISTGSIYVVLVRDVHIPTHEAHLKTEDSWIFTLIR